MSRGLLAAPGGQPHVHEWPSGLILMFLLFIMIGTHMSSELDSDRQGRQDPRWDSSHCSVLFLLCSAHASWASPKCQARSSRLRLEVAQRTIRRSPGPPHQITTSPSPPASVPHALPRGRVPGLGPAMGSMLTGGPQQPPPLCSHPLFAPGHVWGRWKKERALRDKGHPGAEPCRTRTLRETAGHS